MPATKDGRCWPCVQRRRWYAEEVAQVEHGGLRHLALEGTMLCELPRRERHREPEQMRTYRADYDRRRAEANPDGFKWTRAQQARNAQLLRLYGIRWAEHEALYVVQGGRCACCHRGPADCIDHDHATGLVRGLVCGPCNLLLGHAGDDPAVLARAIEYLATCTWP